MILTGKELSRIIGRKIAAAEITQGGAWFHLSFIDGGRAAFQVDGDCCSTSWVEHLELPGDISGAVLLAVEDSGQITSDHAEHDEENGGDCINVYNTRFRTDRGDIVLEYRNSSNGCYGGSLFLASVS